jgi:hypothetical protein
MDSLALKKPLFILIWETLESKTTKEITREGIPSGLGTKNILGNNNKNITSSN